MNRRISLRSLVVSALFGAFLGARSADADELFTTVDRTAAPGERALVHVRTDALGTAAALLYRIEDPTEVLNAGIDLREGADLYVRWKAALDAARKAARNPMPTLGDEAPPGAPDAKPAPHLSFISSTAVPITKDATTPAGQSLEVPVPASGLYLIEVRAGTRAALVSVLVSRVALVTKRDGARLVAFAVDRTSGTAIEGVAVDVRAAGTSLATGKTDAKGLASLAGAFPATIEVRGTLGDELAFGGDTYVPADASTRRVYAFPNQPAYRPGERVEVKGVVRARREGRYELDADVREVSLSFRGGNGQELGKATAVVSADLGTFTAGFDLPPDAPTGDATVVVDAGGKPYAAPFRIEAYRKPVFEVTVAPKMPRVAAGDPLSFDVLAALYEGGVVAGGQLQWTVTYARVDRELFPTDELARLFFGTEREAYAPETIANGTATLDAAGKAHVGTAIALHREDGYLAIRAVVTGPDRTAVTGSGGVGYSAVPLTVALKTDRHLYGAEGTAHVTVKAQLADGRPATGRRGILTAALDRDTGHASAPEEIETASIAFTTTAEGVAVLDVPFGENGRYRLSVALPRTEVEPAGAPAGAALHVYVVGDRADVGFSGDRVEIVADRDDYAIGDTARILVLSPVGARPVLATVEGPRLLSFDTPMLGGGAAGAAAVFEVKIVADHTPNVYVGAALVDRGNVLVATRLLRVPPVDRRLTTVVTAERTEFEPGSKIPMSLKVTDSSGAPVAGAEVAVAIVDDSLYGLFSDPAVPLEPFFHSIRRNDVRTGGPIHLTCVGWSVAPAGLKKDLADHDGEGRAAFGRDGALPPPASSPVPAPAASAEAPRPASDPATGGGGANPPALSELARRMSGDERDAPKEKSKDQESGEGPVEPRADFRTAVAWLPSIRTGADGTAALGPIAFGDALTRWRITSRAIDAATRVGTSVTTVRTAKNVLTRLTLPRFLRVDDRVVAPWTLHSLLTTDADARFVASATGITLDGAHEGAAMLAAGALRTESLALRATKVGEASVFAELRAGSRSDAVRQTFPVLPQGVVKVLASVARSNAGEAITLPLLSLPPTADREGARLEIHVAPSEAQAVAAALPYLLDYPYGCTEQTMSRLVPVLVASAAKNFTTRPTGRIADVDKMIDAGLARLKALRHADGGYGWWERDETDPYMTAYVVHGLSRVRALRKDAVSQELERGAAQWLVGWRQRERASPRPMTTVDALVLMALADAKAIAASDLPSAVADGTISVPTLARAFLLRAAVALERTDDVRIHLASLVARVTTDATGASFQHDPGDLPTLANDPIETTAWAMGAILAADPNHPLLEGGVRWLLSARADGARWNSTRDTAACVAFLTRHAAVHLAAGVGRTIQLSINGLRLRPVTITAENVFSDDATVVLSSADLPNAPILIKAEPDAGGVYLSASLRFTDTGPAVRSASSGLRVERSFWLVEPAGTAGKFLRSAVTESVPSGALLDVDVTVTVTSACEFVMVESPHAAGFEPERDFGTTYETPIPAAVVADHVDRRDDRTVFFVKALPPGAHVFRHRVRATHVGSFTALPASAEEMYTPDVRGNGKGEVLEITPTGAAARTGGGK